MASMRRQGIPLHGSFFMVHGNRIRTDVGDLIAKAQEGGLSWALGLEMLMETVKRTWSFTALMGLLLAAGGVWGQPAPLARVDLTLRSRC